MSYSKDTQSRKWTRVINNPEEHGFNTARIMELLNLFNPDYFCLAEEISPSGTHHIHIFLYSQSPIRFGTIKNRFPTAHIEPVRGTCQENRDYIRKEGKWSGTEKAETRVEGTFQEFGELPTRAQEKAPKLAQVLQDVEDGKSTKEIIRENPNLAFKGKDIDSLRETMVSDQFRYENRVVKVHYLYGDSGTGKTRSIYEQHPAADICRITDYGTKGSIRFDAYHGQPVLVFEEFHSQVPISAMLNYLDIYPLMLPARYNDRVACYTTVYITSNVPLDQQYPEIQKCKMETWRAFLRRIDTVLEFRRGGIIQEVIHEKN